MLCPYSHWHFKQVYFITASEIACYSDFWCVLPTPPEKSQEINERFCHPPQNDVGSLFLVTKCYMPDPPSGKFWGSDKPQEGGRLTGGSSPFIFFKPRFQNY